MAAHKLRTVSFADARVRKLLRDHFVLVWSHYDANAMVALSESFTREQVEATKLGFGGRNVRMFVAAPDGATLAGLGGYWSPEFLAPFLEFSRALDAAGVKDAHARAVVELKERMDAEKDPARRAALEQLQAWYAQGVNREAHISVLLREAAEAVRMRGC